MRVWLIISAFAAVAGCASLGPSLNSSFGGVADWMFGVSEVAPDPSAAPAATADPAEADAGAAAPDTATQAPTEDTPDLRARLACEASGGVHTRRVEGLFTCAWATSDANKSCAAAGDCEGLCLARSRTCAPITPLLGCNEILTASGSAATLCVD
jgi:hypothetical protein